MPRKPRFNARFGWRTDTGRVRKNNEDSLDWYLPEANREGKLSQPCLFAVADGVGGHAAGEVASRLVCTTLVEYFRQAPRNAVIPGLLNDILQRSHAEVLKASNGQGNAGMATTIVSVVLKANQLYVAHVGDSRAYLYHEGQLRLLTRDHTVFNEMLGQGLLDPEELENQIPRNILSRAIGKKGPLHPEIQGPIELLPGSRVLLCTDGIHGFMADDQIEAVITKNADDPQKICDALIQMANELGGKDNSTALVIAVD